MAEHDSALSPEEARAALPAPIVETFDLEAPKPPRVAWGLSSVIGLVGLIGAILAGIDGNDVGTAVGGLAAVAAIVSRGAQAVALARSVARAARPWVEAVAELPDQAVTIETRADGAALDERAVARATRGPRR